MRKHSKINKEGQEYGETWKSLLLRPNRVEMFGHGLSRPQEVAPNYSKPKSLRSTS